MKFRKKPVVLEAVQWLNEADGDSLKNILSLARNGRVTFAADGTADLVIETLEGDMRANVGRVYLDGGAPKGSNTRRSPRRYVTALKHRT